MREISRPSADALRAGTLRSVQGDGKGHAASLAIPYRATIIGALAFILIAAWMMLTPAATVAHAELLRADPPADGLVVTSPERLSLTFTEEVARDTPAPRVTMLDKEGNPVGSDPLPIAESGDPRLLIVDIPDLDRGTYTVSWTVTSATDGHTLSGAYAFRVGGGLPPGLATSEDATPAPWAVATRWLTFLGVSVAAGLLLFGEAFMAGGGSNSIWTRQRSRLILAGSLLALTASLAEPVIQWLRNGNDSNVSFGDTFAALPQAWWWRPAMLIPLTLLAIVTAFPRRGQVARPVAWLGGLMALGSLLGLSLTSHAAGRLTWRVPAIAVDLLHQWSVALWTGGLIALVVWAATKPEGGPGLRLKRFSNTALTLFAVAIVTGLANTGFVFPFVDGIREDGLSTSVFEPLWTSNYGIILLVKVMVLIVPLGLAIYHRGRIARLGTAAASLVSGWPGRFRQTLGAELGLVAVVILGGSAMALSAPPVTVETVLDETTLVASTSFEPQPDTMLVHLTIEPAQTGDNGISVRLSDWDGATIPLDPAPSIALTFTSLDHGTVNSGVGLQPDALVPGTYRTTGLNLSLDGWWQIDARINLAGQPAQEATFYALLPDPNTQGFDAAPKPSSDPEAEELFNTAYAQMLGWERVRWTESLGSGNDVLVRAEFAVIDGEGEAGDAYSLDVLYSGGFAPNSAGEPPEPPTRNSRRSITVGDRGWLRATDGAWLDEPPTRFSTPTEWDTTYAGAENFRLGVTQEIDGVEYQVVTFYLPEQPIQAEAWFAWWINTATGNVERVAMIARQHYMSWTYTDIDGNFTVESPVAE
ncbi:MAG: copper resistance protein CopC/CopD [Chloroflexia bacterium]|nr:copper resistance protein CopC/CopD [Chloroflexia bacterium]